MRKRVHYDIRRTCGTGGTGYLYYLNARMRGTALYALNFPNRKVRKQECSCWHKDILLLLPRLLWRLQFSLLWTICNNNYKGVLMLTNGILPLKNCFLRRNYLLRFIKNCFFFHNIFLAGTGWFNDSPLCYLLMRPSQECEVRSWQKRTADICAAINPKIDGFFQPSSCALTPFRPLPEQWAATLINVLPWTFPPPFLHSLLLGLCVRRTCTTTHARPSYTTQAYISDYDEQ
jgi:hypothetical protein